MDLGRAAQTVAGWAWPRCCAHCREDLDPGEQTPLCLGCRLRLVPNEPPFCRRCSEPARDGRRHCARCERRLFECGIIRGAFLYRDAATSLVHAFKYAGSRAAARAAGRWMAAAWPRFPELGAPDVLVPVPLHPRRRRQRGFNQALLIAEALGEALGIPVVEPLERVRDTRAQWALGREERARNVERAISASKPRLVEGRKALIIDDVCTSTASLEACARALRDAGCADARGYAFARQVNTLQEPL